MLFLVVFFGLFIFLASESRSQNSVNDSCTFRVHLFLCEVFWLHALEILMLAKYLFSPYALRFLQTTRRPSWTAAFWGARGGEEGTLKHPRFIFSSSLVQKIPRVEWYLIFVYRSRSFVLRIVSL